MGPLFLLSLRSLTIWPGYTVGELTLDPRVHLERIGDDAVVLAYALNIGWPSPSVDWLMTTVYVNHDGQWVGIFRMETR